MKFGSFDNYNPVTLGTQDKQQCEYLSSEFMYTSGRYKFSYAKKNGYDTTEVRRNGDVRAVRIEGAAFGKLQDGEWKAKLYFYNSGRGYPGAGKRRTIVQVRIKIASG